MSERNDMVHPPRLQKLKAAFRADVHLAGGQLEAGRLTERSQQRISKWGGPNTNVFAPIDAVAEVTDVIRGLPGAPNTVRALCSLAGGVFVPLPEAAPGSGNVHAALASAHKENSDAVEAVISGFADGQLCAADLDHAIEQTIEAIEAAVRMKAVLERLREEIG